MDYVPIGFEITLGVACIFIARIWWTEFDGERVWRILACLMASAGAAAFAFAGMMASI